MISMDYLLINWSQWPLLLLMEEEQVILVLLWKVDPVKQVIMIRTYWEKNLSCLISLLAPGIVVVNNIDKAVVTWNAPIQPNGVITSYQVIYYIYQTNIGVQSDLLGPNTRSYTIPGTGKQ